MAIAAGLEARVGAALLPGELERAAEKLLATWFADPWVATHKPNVGHLAKQLGKFLSGGTGQPTGEGNATAASYAEWREPDWMRNGDAVPASGITPSLVAGLRKRRASAE
jgi:hypothetical protein